MTLAIVAASLLEHKIAVLIAHGFGDRAIAQVLGLHPAEVLRIDLRIRARLGVRSREDVRRLLSSA